MNKNIKHKIKLLKLVRERIESQNEYFIRNAIYRITAESKYKELFDAGVYLVEYISQSLNAQCKKWNDDVITTLDVWIKHYRPEQYERGFGIQIRQSRLDWIDWMINCYEEDFK